jgi:hypothetical protein
MPRYDQAFFTFLPDESFARYNRDDAMTYDVSGGQLTLRIL